MVGDITGKRVGVRWNPPALIYVFQLGQTLRMARIPIRNLEDDEILDKIYKKHEFGLLRGLKKRYIEKMITILRHHHGIEKEEDKSISQKQSDISNTKQSELSKHSLKSDLLSSLQLKETEMKLSDKDKSKQLGKVVLKHCDTLSPESNSNHSDDQSSKQSEKMRLKQSDIVSIETKLSENMSSRESEKISSKQHEIISDKMKSKRTDNKDSVQSEKTSSKQSDKYSVKKSDSLISENESDSLTNSVRSAVDLSTHNGLPGINNNSVNKKGLINLTNSTKEINKNKNVDILKLLDAASRSFDETENTVKKKITNENKIIDDTNNSKNGKGTIIINNSDSDIKNSRVKIPDVIIKRTENVGMNSVKDMDLSRPTEKLGRNNPVLNIDKSANGVETIKDQYDAEDTDLDLEDVDIPLDPEEPKKSSDSELLEEEDFWA